jgi:hypothetical protein
MTRRSGTRAFIAPTLKRLLDNIYVTPRTVVHLRGRGLTAVAESMPRRKRMEEEIAELTTENRALPILKGQPALRSELRVLKHLIHQENIGFEANQIRTNRYPQFAVISLWITAVYLTGSSALALGYFLLTAYAF